MWLKLGHWETQWLHHSQVLKRLAAAVEDRRGQVNLLAAVIVVRQINFVREASILTAKGGRCMENEGCH